MANRNRKEQHERQLGESSRPRPSTASAASASYQEEEQEPVMRHAAITGPRRVLHEPKLQRVAGLGHRSPDALQIKHSDRKEPPEQIQQRSLRKQRQLSDSAIYIDTPHNPWIVDKTAIPPRPDDFPMLRTIRVVSDAPQKIADRLVECLRDLSIKAKYSRPGDAEPLAKCRNMDFCKFTIRLHSADPTEGKPQGGTMVEVQRLCGDALSFMKDCRALLDAAEGKFEGTANIEDEKPMWLQLPVSEMEFLKTAPPLPPAMSAEPEHEAESVRVTSDLLASRLSDANMLGMESLVIQTDPAKTPKSTAVAACRMVLVHDHPGNAPFSVHNYVMSLLIYGDESSRGFPEDSALEEHSSRLRNLAMSTLHNALSLLRDESDLRDSIDPNLEWYESVLVPRLLDDLSGASDSPFDACYASRCLTALLEGGKVGMDPPRLSKKAEEAEKVGEREFAMLARDASVLRRCLDSKGIVIQSH